MIEPFKDPRLDAPTPIHLDGDVVYGHVAGWHTEHIGARGVNAPRNHSDYRYFHLGGYEHDGQVIDVGQITMHTTHAGLRLPADEARKAYEDTGAVAAYIRCGEDAHGIWFSGKLAKGLDEADREALLGSKVSGDWRPIQGRAELIGVLAVCIPGFPIPRARALVAAGDAEPLALVAAGIVLDAEPDTSIRLRARVARKRLAARLR